jgi:hypothetical protein
MNCTYIGVSNEEAMNEEEDVLTFEIVDAERLRTACCSTGGRYSGFTIVEGGAGGLETERSGLLTAR